MLKIGVCGLIGAGKSTFLDYIKNKDYYVIDADNVSKQVINDPIIINFLKENIEQVLDENNNINRILLREKIFNNPELNNQFIQLMWPLISKKINQILIKLKDYKLVFIEAAMINGLDIDFDKIILLSKDYNITIDQIKNRDNRDIKEIKSIIEYQKEKIKDIKFDYIIKNNNNIQDFYNQIETILEEINKSEE